MKASVHCFFFHQVINFCLHLRLNDNWLGNQFPSSDGQQNYHKSGALGIQIGRSDNYQPLSGPSVFTIANLDNQINIQTWSQKTGNIVFAIRRILGTYITRLLQPQSFWKKPQCTFIDLILVRSYNNLSSCISSQNACQISNLFLCLILF